MVIYRFLRRIDPCSRWFGWGLWGFPDEAFRIFSERDIEDLLADFMDGIGLPVVNLVRGHEADAGMVVVLIVPGEEVSTVLFGIFDATKSTGKPWLVL